MKRLKAKLPPRELEICKRLREARDYVGVTQLECARRIQIERSTLTNYESGLTPLRYEVALRFCRQLIISEEWLATGRAESMKAAVMKTGVHPGGDLRSLDSIFVRQCMDLLSEPITSRIPPGALYSLAYDKYLAPRYNQLAHDFPYTPRIVTDPDRPEPEMAAMLLNAYIERWLKMLGNEALRQSQPAWEAQRIFVRALVESGAHIFRKFMGFRTDAEALGKLEWLKQSLAKPDTKLGPIHSNRPAETVQRNTDVIVTA